MDAREASDVGVSPPGSYTCRPRAAAFTAIASVRIAGATVFGRKAEQRMRVRDGGLQKGAAER